MVNSNINQTKYWDCSERGYTINKTIIVQPTNIIYDSLQGPLARELGQDSKNLKRFLKSLKLKKEAYYLSLIELNSDPIPLFHNSNTIENVIERKNDDIISEDGNHMLSPIKDVTHIFGRIYKNDEPYSKDIKPKYFTIDKTEYKHPNDNIDNLIDEYIETMRDCLVLKNKKKIKEFDPIIIASEVLLVPIIQTLKKRNLEYEVSEENYTPSLHGWDIHK